MQQRVDDGRRKRVEAALLADLVDEADLEGALRAEALAGQRITP